MDALAIVLMGVAGVAAGAVAAIAGFGIGSILTPLLAFWIGTKLAVAAVSIPHVGATTLRFFMMREQLDRRVFLTFGIASAVSGLIGALLHNLAGGPALSMVLGILLLFAGIMGLTGLSKRMRFGGAVAWFAGALSGLFGGLVGNQGGIRSAALLGFDLRPGAFVATATAIALAVDAARVPIYLAQQASELALQRTVIIAMLSGALLGTIVGGRVLRRIPEQLFLRVIALILIGGAILMFYRASTSA